MVMGMMKIKMQDDRNSSLTKIQARFRVRLRARRKEDAQTIHVNLTFFHFNHHLILF